MKTKTIQIPLPQRHSIHQRVEYFFRARASVLIVVGFMLMAMLSVDSHFRNFLRAAYQQGFSWVGTYMRHEHPSHNYFEVDTSRIPTTSGRADNT
jgi:hypothetical protein